MLRIRNNAQNLFFEHAGHYIRPSHIASCVPSTHTPAPHHAQGIRIKTPQSDSSESHCSPSVHVIPTASQSRSATLAPSASHSPTLLPLLVFSLQLIHAHSPGPLRCMGSLQGPPGLPDPSSPTSQLTTSSYPNSQNIVETKSNSTLFAPFACESAITTRLSLHAAVPSSNEKMHVLSFPPSRTGPFLALNRAFCSLASHSGVR